MANIELPHFGHIDSTQLDECYAVVITYCNLRLELDLNFEKKNLSDEQATDIKGFLSDISILDVQNKIEIEKDFNDEGETADYISFFLEELDEGELRGIIDYDNENKPKEEQLLSKLRLIRVGLYPDGKNGAGGYGVFDYSIEIDGEPCNQLLVVNRNEKRDLDHITWES